MQYRSCPARVLLASVAVLLTGIIPRSSGGVLLRIDAVQHFELPRRLANNFQVLQQLESCWIAKSSMEEYLRFEQAGGSGTILDVSPADRDYYLLSSVARDQFPKIATLGDAIPVENGIVLFWSENQYFRDLLPRNIHLKSLPSETPLRIEFDDSRQKAARDGPKSAAEPREPSESIANLVAQVSVDNIRSNIQDLASFQTRRVSTMSCEFAGTYLYEFFANLGIAAEYDPFIISKNSIATRNIVATIPGKTTPERVILIGAHYDSTSNQALSLAPGADDNASGTASVMEIARLMRDQPFEATVKFVCFSGEELGLYGSRHYTQQAHQAGEQIEAMINLDMVGYAATANEDLDIISNYGSSWLADVFLASAATYTATPVLKSVLPSVIGSDHSPFWDQGYSAVFGTESAPLKNPYYHKTTDTIETLDIEFAASATKAALATAAVLAHPCARSPLPPYGLTVRTENVYSFSRQFKNVFLRWKSDDRTVTGFNIYRAENLHSSFVRINIDPVRQSRFVDRYVPPDAASRYAVTALDGDGNESVYSQ